MPPNVVHLQQQLNSSTRELSNITSSFWLVPKDEIGGIIGYFCENCQAFELEFVRDIGYDKTAEARHYCHEDKVKIRQKISAEPSDITAREDVQVRELPFYIKSLNPNIQYLIAQDVSKACNAVRNNFNSLANIILGFPDRYCLCRYHESDTLDWINRALSNLGKKIIIDKSEMVDFLKRTKSTYAIFEIQMETRQE